MKKKPQKNKISKPKFDDRDLLIDQLYEELEKLQSLVNSMSTLTNYMKDEKDEMISDIENMSDQLVISSFKERFLIDFIKKNNFTLSDIREYITELKVDKNISKIKQQILDHLYNDKEEENEDE